MESGSGTDDEEDDECETRLYSLLHHSGENLMKEVDLLPGTPSERVYVEQSSSPGVITPFYQSKGSKAFRLDIVNSLIVASDVPPQNVKIGTLSSNVENKRLIEPGQQKIQNNYHNLLCAYKEAISNRMQSELAKKQNFKNTSSDRRYSERVHKVKTVSNVSNVDDSYFTKINSPVIRESSGQSRNTVTVSDSSCQSKIITSVAERYHTYVHRTSYTYDTNSINNGNINSYTHIKSKYSKSPKSNGEKLLGDNVGVNTQNSKNIDRKIEMRDEENRHKQLEGEYSMSKYSICLNKDKEDSKEESVIVLDSSDSDGESVVEVDCQVREPPSVICLSSDEEIVKDMSSKEKLNNTTAENDIVVHYTDGKSDVPKVLPTLSVDNIRNESLESAGSSAAVVLSGKSTTGKDPQEKKRKKKKHKRVKSGRNQTKRLNLVYQSPKSWSKDMSHFYNDSWGGETFDVRQLQKSMPDNRSSWCVLYDDIVSRSIRKRSNCQNKCANCNTWGHATNYCPSPRKAVVCIFCGKIGHSKFRCPTPICLRCGKSSVSYKKGCRKCFSSKTSYQPCNVCNIVGHRPAECPEVWRRYHSLTTSEDLSAVPSRTLYKPQEEKFCCKCARRGHHFHECRVPTDNFHTLSHNSLKHKSSTQKQHEIPSKSRKCKRNSANVSLFNLFSQGCYYGSIYK